MQARKFTSSQATHIVWEGRSLASNLFNNQSWLELHMKARVVGSAMQGHL